MIAVIDANVFISGKLDYYKYDTGYTTSAVWKEIKDAGARRAAEINSYRIQIKDPSPVFVKEVVEFLRGKHLLLSEADVSIVALSIELKSQSFDVWITPNETKDSIICLTEDNALLQALSHFDILSNKYTQQRTYKIRCYACFALYDDYMDFCKKCGYQTLTRVSVTQDGDNIKLHLKKNFKPRNRVLKVNGRIVMSADQKEYKIYQKDQKKKKKQLERALSNLP